MRAFFPFGSREGIGGQAFGVLCRGVLAAPQFSPSGALPHRSRVVL